MCGDSTQPQWLFMKTSNKKWVVEQITGGIWQIQLSTMTDITLMLWFLKYYQCWFTLTTSLFVAVVRAVIIPITHFSQRNTVSIFTSEFSGGAGGLRGLAHVLQLIRLIPTVIVSITDKVVGHTAAVLACELVWLTGLVSAALLITAVSTVVAPVTPDFERRHE